MICRKAARDPKKGGVVKVMKMAAIISALISPVVVHGADFMGIEIGAKFDLPECQADRARYSSGYAFDMDQPVRPCWQHSILKGKPGDYLDTEGSFKVDFVADGSKRPAGVRANSTSLVVVNGVIEGVDAGTAGLEYQDALLRALQDKFGKPSSLKEDVMENRMGASFSSHEAVWKLPAFEVNFSGMVNRLDFGYISVFTPRALQFTKDELERKKKAAPSF